MNVLHNVQVASSTDDEPMILRSLVKYNTTVSDGYPGKQSNLQQLVWSKLYKNNDQDIHNLH